MSTVAVRPSFSAVRSTPAGPLFRRPRETLLYTGVPRNALDRVQTDEGSRTERRPLVSPPPDFFLLSFLLNRSRGFVGGQRLTRRRVRMEVQDEAPVHTHFIDGARSSYDPATSTCVVCSARDGSTPKASSMSTSVAASRPCSHALSKRCRPSVVLRAT